MADPDVLVILAGGLGSSQLKADSAHPNFETAFRNNPRFDVLPVDQVPGMDYVPIIRANRKPQHKFTVLVGHSFAGLPEMHAIEILNAVPSAESLAYVAFIDPVSNHMLVGRVRMPDARPPFKWVRRAVVGVTLGFIEVPLEIDNAGEPDTSYEGGHNELPHDPRLIADVESEIMAAIGVQI